MSRLIDINAVIRMLNTLDRYTSTELTLCDTDKTFPKNEVFVVDDVYEGLEQLPSAEPRKKGKWILDPDGMDWNLPAWRCSLCGCKNNNIGVVAKGEGLGQNPLMWAGSKYCPNCGSDMREGEEE